MVTKLKRKHFLLKLINKKKKNTTTVAFLRKNWALILAIFYFFFPLDIIPDIIPGFGFGDDILVLLATLFVRYRKSKKEGKDTVIEGELVDG